MAKYVQGTPEPTRKISAFVLASAIMQVAGIVVRVRAPEYYDVDAWNALTLALAGLFAYVIKESA